MARKIFKSIITVCVIVLLASVVFTSEQIYDYFIDTHIEELKLETNLLGYGIQRDGIDFLDSFEEYNNRITIIDSDGTVLFDNSGNISDMDNHLDREEVKQAMENGYGYSRRYSDTLTEQLIYTAMKLNNGWIVRLSTSYSSVFFLVLPVINPLLIVILVMLILSSFLATRLAKKIVEPINMIDVDNPDSESCYKELQPFMEKITAQQEQINENIASLERKKQEFEAITENMNEGMIILNNKSTVLDINRFASEILDMNEDNIGRKLSECRYYDLFKDMLEEQQYETNINRTIRINNVNYSVESSPVTVDGVGIGVVLLIIDNSYKEANEKLRKEFSSNVSHELKTPLQTIIGYSELLKNGLVPMDRQEEVADKIYAQSQRMVSLINDIIKLSHLDDEDMVISKEDIDIYALTASVLKSVETVIENAGITVTFKGEKTIVHGNEQLLESTIFNLIDNAIKYNRKNGTIDIDIYQHEDRKYFRIKDSGIGIRKEDYERIFERFYQVDKARSATVGGTGLGLSIVKHALLLNNATIDVDSVFGKGTTFTICFNS